MSLRSLIRLVVFSLLTVISPASLRAQGNGSGNGGGHGGGAGGGITIQSTTDSIPPEVYIVPSGGTYTDSLLDVTVYWCDDKGLDDASRKIRQGFPYVTSNFTYQSIAFAEPCNVFGDVYKSEGTINLNDGTSLTASIKDDYGNSGNDAASYSFDPELPPVVWTTPWSEGYWNPSHQVANGFEMVVSHATPGYTFKGKHRSLTFVYRSDQAKPRVLVDAKVSSDGADPDKFSMKVKDPSGSFMTFLNNNSTEIFWDGTQSTVRLGGVVDASGLGTGAHDLTVLVRSHFGGSFEETVDTVRALVVDESNSPYGEGWSIAGIQKAYVQTDSSVMITEGDGSAVYFAKSGSTYTAPNGDFSELVSSGSGWKRIYTNGDTVTFNSSGRMTRFAPLYGHADNSISYSYGGSGELTELDPSGSNAIGTYLTFDADSILIEEGSSSGASRSTVIHLNGSNQVTSIEGPDGNDELSFGYSTGRIASATDGRSKTTDYTYDPLGYLASAQLPQISVEGQNVRPELDQQSLAMTVGPDSITGDGTSGNPATPVAVANVKPWIEDARGARTFFTLDVYGFRTAGTIEEPLSRTTSITINTNAQVTRIDQPSGAYSTTGWSGPRVTSTYESTTGRTVTYQYANPPESNFNQPIRVYDNQGNREVWYDYDGSKRLTGVYYDTIGFYGDLVASYTYRLDGQLLTGTDSDTGHLVKYSYETSLNYENVKTVKAIRGADTLTTRFEYGDYGRRVKTVNPAGDSTFMEYDDLDRVQWSVNTLGDTTFVDSYDGYLADTLTNARGKSYSSVYNSLGWVIKTTDPEAETDSIGYDENGNVIRVVDRLGNIATLEYDSLNQPKYQEVEGDTIHLWTDPDGTKSAAWNAVSKDSTFYDDLGRPTKYKTCRGTGFSRCYSIRTAYDDDGPRNRLWIDSPGSIDYDMRYTWNDQGQLSKISNYVPTTPVHTQFEYNDHFQLDSVSIGGSKRWSVDYSEFHPAGQTIYENNLHTELGSSVKLDTALLRITQINWADGDTVRALEYDAQNQITTVTDSAFSSPTCEWYDNYGELCYGGGGSELGEDTYAYDAVGNRTDLSASVTNANRLSSMDGYTFTHDDEGRTLTKSKSGFSQTYHWNDRGQVDSVTTVIGGNSGVVRYTYDGLGRRITRDGPGGFEEYLYDGAHVIVTMDGNQNVLRTFSYYPGVDKPHSVMTDTATYYYAVDPTGSVIGLAEYDGTATVVNHYRYDVWGMPQGTETEGVENPIRFKSRWWDADTKLVDFRSRWYDPEIGRFISEDPIGLAGGINVFTFAGNNPVSGWDPFGLDPDEPCDSDYDPSRVTTDPVGYTESGIPIFATIEACVDGGPPPPILGDGPSPGVGPGGTAYGSSSGTGGKSGGAGAGSGAEQPPTIHHVLGRTCAADAISLVTGSILDFAGFGALDVLRLSRFGRDLNTLESVRLAVGASTLPPRTVVGFLTHTFDHRTYAGPLFGTVANWAARIPGVGLPFDVVGTSISCGSAAYAAAYDYLAVP